jgi:hypothetical protein
MRGTRGGISSADMIDDRRRGTVGRKRRQDVRKPTDGTWTSTVGFSIQSLFNSLSNHLLRADLARAALEARPQRRRKICAKREEEIVTISFP